MNSKSDKCKFFHHEPYMTPNNFDLYFDYNSIPANIVAESNNDLRRRLQRLMPLSKFIHLEMDNDSLECKDNMRLSTSMNLRFKEDNEYVVKEVKIV